MIATHPRDGRSRSTGKSVRRRRHIAVERLEPRRLFTNTIQVEISGVDSITARDVENLPLNFSLRHLMGLVTLTGDNLASEPVGNGFRISGTVSAINDISLSNSTALSSLSVRAHRGDGMTLGSFESPNPMNDIDLCGIDLTGLAQLFAPPRLHISRADAATIDITQIVPSFDFKGYSFNDSLININSPTLPQDVNLDLHTVTDTQVITTDFIKSLKLQSFTATTSGSGGITAGGVGSFNVLGDYKADLTFKPTLDLKYTLDNFNIRGTASGSWNISGATRSLYAHTFDNGFNGSFGSLSTFRVGTDFSGSFTAGSLGTGTIGGNVIGATLDFTNPFAANSWNLGSFHVGNIIENSMITSNGNLGDISTMYTFNSQITAGMSGYQFGQPITSADYTSYSTIKSFVSDCPSHHFIHFIDSYVGAAYLSSIRLGNAQTDNSGIPFGLAGIRMDKVSVLVNSRILNFSNLDSAASFDVALQKDGTTQENLVDLIFEFLD